MLYQHPRRQLHGKTLSAIFLIFEISLTDISKFKLIPTLFHYFAWVLVFSSVLDCHKLQKLFKI
jgi:hypothetical protein